MAALLQAFPGAANRTRCFAHILNLVAKCIMKQFDAPKKKKGAEVDDFDDNENDATDLQVALDELEDECKGRVSHLFYPPVCIWLSSVM